MIQGKDGQKVVAIISGNAYSKGMEVWNPRTKSVELVANEIPPEQQYGFAWGQLLTIKEGTELMLYGGINWLDRESRGGIWKYIVSENSWTRYLLPFIPL